MATKAAKKKSNKQPRIKKVILSRTHRVKSGEQLPKEWVNWTWNYAKEPSAKQLIKDKIFVVGKVLKVLYESDNKNKVNHKSTFGWSKNGLVLNLKASFSSIKIAGGAATGTSDPPPPKQPPPPSM